MHSYTERTSAQMESNVVALVTDAGYFIFCDYKYVGLLNGHSLLFVNFLYIIFTNPSARAGYDTRSIFKRSLTGLNSEFSFS